jgi:hypothetical protein
MANQGMEYHGSTVKGRHTLQARRLKDKREAGNSGLLLQENEASWPARNFYCTLVVLQLFVMPMYYFKNIKTGGHAGSHL